VLRRLDRFLLAGALMIVAQLGFRAWALWGSWFYFDDIAFMSRAMNQPFDLSYLTESYGGHLMPAGFALAWVLTKFWVYVWAPWAVVLLVLQAVAAIGMFRLLVSMFGRRPLVLVLLAGYLAWVFTVPAGIWWAAGINQLPLQIALAFGLTAHLAYLRTRRVHHLVGALLWVAGGLLFYEKTLLVIGVYAIVTLAYFTAGTTPERLRELWDTYRPAVIGFGALGVVYLAVYVRFGLDFSPGDSSGEPWGQLAWNFVMVTFASAIVGGPLAWQSLGVGSLADPSTLVQLVGWAALGGALYYAFLTRTTSRRAWFPLVFTVTANIVLLASARAIVVGPDIAREYRYQTESGAVFAICLGLALMPLVGARELNAEKPEVPRPYEVPRFVLPATAVVVALAILSTTRYVGAWQDGNPSEAFFDAAQSELTSASEPVPLIDVGLPQALLWSYRYPENIYSHVFRNLEDDTVYPDDAIDDLFVFDDTGHLAQVGVPPTRSMRPVDGCGYSLSDAATSIPLDGPVIGGGWWIQVEYKSATDTPVRFTAGDSVHDMELPAGRHTAFFSAEGTFRQVQVQHDGEASDEDPGLCVTSLVLGLPVPTR
jgi:hypothetical protein